MVERNKIKLVVILGATSTGKTDLSLIVAKKFNGEIVSADSRQVYKGLDIGTGKATRVERKKAPHYLLDIANPGKTITLAQYKKMADAAIFSIWRKGKVPFLVGGSSLYLQAVIDNYQLPNVRPNPKLRKKLQKLGAARLLAMLKKLDPVSAQRISPFNIRRLIRAIEVSSIAGKPFSQLQGKGSDQYNTLILGLTLPREELYKRIDARVDARIRQGMIGEVKKLLAQGVRYTWLQTLGLEYRHISESLNNGAKTKDKQAYLQKLKYAIHDFARRQIIWFRRDHRIHWIHPKDTKNAKKLISDFLDKK